MTDTPPLATRIEGAAEGSRELDQWRVAPGTYGFYEVSNLGRVRRAADGLLLKVSCPRHSREYPSVMMRYLGLRKRRSVHTLVAMAFVGPPPFIGAQVRHLDGDHLNPRADNLAWGTAAENAVDRERHGTTAKGERHGMYGVSQPGSSNPNASLTDEQVTEIVRMSKAGQSQRWIALAIGSAQTTVWKVLSGRTYQAAALRAQALAEKGV